MSQNSSNHLNETCCTCNVDVHDNFSEARPRGSRVNFSEARPRGSRVNFSEARPSGSRVNFSEARPRGSRDMSFFQTYISLFPVTKQGKGVYSSQSAIAPVIF